MSPDDPLQDAVFEPVLRPERLKRTVSPRQIEERGGLAADDVVEMVRSLGLPISGPDEAWFTEEEAAELATRGSATLASHKARASAGTVRIGTLPGGAPGPRAVLAIPSSYMNESGGPVKALLSFFSVEPDHLVVVHDELDIAAGDVRLKKGGGQGGANSLRSISSAPGTRDYCRVRVVV